MKRQHVTEETPKAECLIPSPHSKTKPNAPEEALESIKVDKFMGSKDIREATGFNANDVAKLLNSGLIPTLKWGTVKKIRVSDFNAFFDRVIREGTDLREMLGITAKNTG